MASSASSLYHHYISPCLNNNKGGGGGLRHFPLNTATSHCSSTKKQQPLQIIQQHLKLQNQEKSKEDDETSTGRRQFMLQTPVFAFSFSQLIMSNGLALAETDVPQDFRVYTDEVNKFKIFIPQDWQVGAGEPNNFKSITAFFPEEAAKSNVSVAITGLGPDFTRIESFGKVEEFADTLVSGLDRSWQRPPGVTAKLIDCKSSKGIYYIEYTMQNPGESKRHLFSAIGMANNGWYNRLYTVTGQFVEDEAEKYGSRIEKAVSSFKFI